MTKEDTQLQAQENARKSREHIVDSTNILIFLFLLVLVTLTIWHFKRKRLYFIHETGLAIFYGIFRFWSIFSADIIFKKNI
jgi:hypothetical protein